MSNIRICHLGLNNPDVTTYCHAGYPGTNHLKPMYEACNEPPLHCAAWNEEFNVCNLVLQPVITVNNIAAEEHSCRCGIEAEE